MENFLWPSPGLLCNCETSQIAMHCNGSFPALLQSVWLVPGLMESVGRPAADEAEDLDQGHPEVGPPPDGPPLHLLGSRSEIRRSVMGYNGESWRGRGPNFYNHLMCVK